MLGKPIFPCDEMTLHLRWRAARPECMKGDKGDKQQREGTDGGGDAVET